MPESERKNLAGAQPQNIKGILKTGFDAGTSGAMAMTIQVTTLMWMRTTMNFQYRYGMTTTQAMKTLWQQGGVLRFYRGFGPALLQGPLSRFGDTAANVGVLAFLQPYPEVPLAVKTGLASVTAGLFRIAVMPIDAAKTTLQVEGKVALKQLGHKIRTSPGGPLVLWHGSLAAASATIVGHFPWFFTFNLLQEKIPVPEGKIEKVGRNAFIGFVASAISDTISNSLRVIKTTRQTFPNPITYPNVVRHIVLEDGILGLMGRGLKTRILTNGLQGLMFSVLWKYIMDARKSAAAET